MFSVELDESNGHVIMLDQRRIPEKEEYIRCKSVGEVYNAIKNMVVRGAPAIGVAAAYGLAIGDNITKDAELLKYARPTAVDLWNAIEYVSNSVRKGMNKVEAAKRWHDMIKEKTKKIAEYGARIIKDGDTVLLHCNAGPLATAGYGTSLGAVIEAKRQGKDVKALVCETRPRIQGAITSWELLKYRIEHKVIVDSAAGFFIKNKNVSVVFVGADRVLKSGDFANKIGTYSIGVVSRENNTPFYVFAPISTFDKSDGKTVTIEERGEEEVLTIKGHRIYPKDAEALNPAFDITEAKYVSAYITEFGIHRTVDELWKSIEE